MGGNSTSRIIRLLICTFIAFFKLPPVWEQLLITTKNVLEPIVIHRPVAQGVVPDATGLLEILQNSGWTRTLAPDNFADVLRSIAGFVLTF